jgi:hypothetical protein
MGLRSRVAVVVLCAFLASCSEAAVQPDDLPLLVTIADFADFGYALDAYTHHQNLRRVRYFDGSLDIESAFTTPAGAEDYLHFSATAGFARSLSDARTGHRFTQGGLAIGSRWGGATLRTIPDFYSWGDESFYGLMEGPEGPFGTVFGARLGRRTYVVTIGGLYFDEPEDWAEFIGPKLAYLKEYRPQGRK